MFAIIDNSSKKFFEYFRENLKASKRVWLASAFIKGDTVKTLLPDFEKILNQQGSIDVLAGLDFHITDGKALRLLYELTLEYENFALGCYSGSPWETDGSFHPKFYLFEKGENLQVLIGSSNLTFGGMNRNVEINASLRIPVKSPEAEAALDTFLRLKTARNRIVPNLKYIKDYEIAHAKISKSFRRPRVQKSLNRIISNLKQSERKLKRPSVTEFDLIGWKKDVFELLPPGEFHVSEIYKWETELQRKHPENQNVRPKIRQILQQLRDLGLLQHIREGHWKPI